MVVELHQRIASVAAVILYLAAVVLSNREGGQQERDGVLTCYVVKPGVFAAGATFSIFSTFFGIVAYRTVSSATQSTSRLELEPPNAIDVIVEEKPVHGF
ncbi:hypothetical protein L2E82_47569 [Cichorium intybus]|uniref:Uncharacterized protein n=1 Tax=Cichorium intybus TaxID=13427 RepID=A0ACB8YWX2_CICIN|nr:hypothetical protein L2E82_47569 [Cichorium intybus]